MITLLTGRKGSGKTKKLIEMANAALRRPTATWLWWKRAEAYL